MSTKECESEDEFVDRIIETIDYDILKDIKNIEQEDQEQSDERIMLKCLLDEYYKWRTHNDSLLTFF